MQSMSLASFRPRTRTRLCTESRVRIMCSCDRIERHPISGVFHEETLAVRLFIGNLPYGASEADLRAHFAAVAEPSHVAMPVDRETGRPRGFAFVEFAERAVAEEVIRKFDSQPFQGRPLAVSEARAREDRPPRPPGGGGFAPRPGGGGGGFGGPRPGGGGFGGPRPRWRRIRRPTSRWRWIWRPTDRSRRSRPERELRSSCATETVARQEDGATGTQASRTNQGTLRRSHLRRGRSRRRLSGRDRRYRDKGERGRLDGRNRRYSQRSRTRASTIRMRNNRT